GHPACTTPRRDSPRPAGAGRPFLSSRAPATHRRGEVPPPSNTALRHSDTRLRAALLPTRGGVASSTASCVSLLPTSIIVTQYRQRRNRASCASRYRRSQKFYALFCRFAEKKP